MRLTMHRVVVCAALVCACAGVASAQRVAPRFQVRQIVAEQACSTADLAPDVANAFVESYSVLHDGKDCVIAFFRDLNRHGSPLEIIRFLDMRSSWAHADIAVNDADRSPIESVELEGESLLISLHRASGEFAIALVDSNLKKVAVIYGTFVRSWPNGLLEYDLQRPQVGPQDLRIGVLDPSTATDRQIYPPSPCDPVRTNYVQQLQKASLEQDKERSDGCWTESRRLAPSYFDWRTNTFAFAAELLSEYSASSRTGQRVEVMVTCAGLASVESIRCRETPLEAWQSARPDLNLTQLIVFAASQPRFR